MPIVSIHQRGYTHPELLAETDWLAKHLDDSNVRIVDARPPQQYAAGHIPGAVNLSGTNGIPRTADGEMASPEEFSLVAGKLGIGNRGAIVVYDMPNQHMGLVAWAFLYYGHRDVRLLDGGFEKWTREGRPVSTQPADYPEAIFNAKPVDAIYCSLSHAKAAHARPQSVFWDTRSLAEFHGAGEGHGKPPPRPGHIAGAAHLDWIELIDPETKTFKAAAELRALLESKGITPEREVNTYCGGGRRGSIGTLVLMILGYNNARSYAAGFSQWSRQPDTPVEAETQPYSVSNTLKEESSSNQNHREHYQKH